MKKPTGRETEPISRSCPVCGYMGRWEDGSRESVIMACQHPLEEIREGYARRTERYRTRLVREYQEYLESKKKGKE